MEMQGVVTIFVVNLKIIMKLNKKGKARTKRKTGEIQPAFQWPLK
jgi:hypothetical protein